MARKHLVLLALIFLPGATAAEEVNSEKEKRASEIFELSNTFGPPELSFRSGNNRSAILLDNCKVTLVRLLENPFKPDNGSSAAIFTFDLVGAKLIPMPDGDLFDFLELKASFPFGAATSSLQFSLQEPWALRIIDDLPGDTPLSAVLEAPSNEIETSPPFALYVHDRNPIRDNMARLATSLVDYKQDFCTLSS